MPYRFLADATLSLHVTFVVFVVLGLLLTVIGGYRGWRWIRNRWFRITHLVAIMIVVGQAWLGLNCPLTTLEMWFRRQAGDAHYDGSCIQYWLQQLLYYQAPMWVFAAVYSLFGLMVVVAWVSFPPQLKTRPRTSPSDVT